MNLTTIARGLQDALVVVAEEPAVSGTSNLHAPGGVFFGPRFCGRQLFVHEKMRFHIDPSCWLHILHMYTVYIYIYFLKIYLRICLSHYCALPASANTAWDPFWEQECSPFPPVTVTVGPTVIYNVFGANAWQIDTPRRRCNKHEQQKTSIKKYAAPKKSLKDWHFRKFNPKMLLLDSASVSQQQWLQKVSK